jgi:hypothetical protein
MNCFVLFSDNCHQNTTFVKFYNHYGRWTYPYHFSIYFKIVKEIIVKSKMCWLHAFQEDNYLETRGYIIAVSNLMLKHFSWNIDVHILYILSEQTNHPPAKWTPSKPPSLRETTISKRLDRHILNWQNHFVDIVSHYQWAQFLFKKSNNEHNSSIILKI